jgi:hypothetical protein
MNQRPTLYTFQRYLAAKRTVDDRALNHHVWQSLHDHLARRASPSQPLNILELGGGIGTMVERLLDEGRLPDANYHLLDEQPDNIAAAAERLGKQFSTPVPKADSPLRIVPSHIRRLRSPTNTLLDLHLYTSDLFEFLATAGPLAKIDLILAHAFMDLVDIPSTLPLLTASLRPGTLLYFTINFDGATILEPAIDPAFDMHIERVYHRTMDERITNGKPSGDSHTGRHLFHQMQTTGIRTLDAGSSDWVVIPHDGAYPHDEGYFLHFIIRTMDGALRHHPDIDPQRFQEWIATRHAQIERGELVYIAHQLDYLGEFQGSN